MQRLRKFASTPAGYFLILALIVGLFLLAIGLSTDSLPFPRSSEFSDAATSHWPNALQLQRFLRGEQVGLGNPYVMNNQSWVYNPLSKVFYPPQWLVALLPVTVHLNVLLWLHLVWAGFGMCLFTRRLGMSATTASILGALFALTPRLVSAAGAGHLDVVYAVSWLPWLLLLIHRSGEGARSPRVRNTILLGLSLALCFYADVRISAVVFIFAGAYWLFNIRRAVPDVITSGLIGLLLMLPALIPLISELPKLSRAGLTPADAGVFSLGIVDLIGIVSPVQGSSHETMTYAGFGVLMLAVLGVRIQRAKVRFWVVGVLITALYALGANGLLWSLMIRVFPPLLWLRVPARLWILVVFSLLILAGYGLEAIQSGNFAQRMRRSTKRIALVLVPIGLIGALIILPFDPGSGLIALCVVLTFGAVLLFQPTLPPLGWAALLLIDLLLLNTTLIDGVGRFEWLDQYQPIAAALQADGVDHLYSPTYSFPQQAAVYYKLPILGGVDPFQYADYVKAVETATGVYATGYSVTLPALEGVNLRTVNRDAHPDPVKLAALGVSHVAAAYPMTDPSFELLRIVNGVYLYRNKAYAASR